MNGYTLVKGKPDVGLEMNENLLRILKGNLIFFFSDEEVLPWRLVFHENIIISIVTAWGSIETTNRRDRPEMDIYHLADELELSPGMQIFFFIFFNGNG